MLWEWGWPSCPRIIYGGDHLGGRGVVFRKKKNFAGPPGATRYLPAAHGCSGEEKRTCNRISELANCRSSSAVISLCSAVSPNSENSQMRKSLILFTNRTDFGLHGSLGPDQVSASWQHTLHLWHFHDVVHGGPMPVQASIRMWVGA